MLGLALAVLVVGVVAGALLDFGRRQAATLACVLVFVLGWLVGRYWPH